MSFRLRRFQTEQDERRSFLSGMCDAMTSHSSHLNFASKKKEEKGGRCDEVKKFGGKNDREDPELMIEPVSHFVKFLLCRILNEFLSNFVQSLSFSYFPMVTLTLCSPIDGAARWRH